jgi:hypothetical protein
MIYTHLLKLYGYATHNTVPDDMLPISISIDDMGNIHNEYIVKKDGVMSDVLFLLKCYYNTLVFSIMIWSVMYSVVLSIEYNTLNYFSGQIFQMIIAIQYLYGIRYFHNTISVGDPLGNTGTNSPEGNNHMTKIFAQHPYLEKQFNLGIVVSTVLGCIACIVSIIAVSTQSFQIYGQMSDQIPTNVMMILVISIDKFYSYSTFFVNTTVFIINIFYHKFAIVEYHQKVKKYAVSSTSLAKKINEITVDFVQLKNDYYDTVQQLNDSFATLNILGLINLYFVIRMIVGGNISTNDVVNIIIFFLVEWIYINSVFSLRTTTSHIIHAIKSAILSQNYNEKDVLNKDLVAQNTENYIMQIFVTTVETSSILSWIVLRDILDSKWASFNIVGIEISDNSIIQKIYALLMTLLIANNLASLL